jgi:hypothetical protein
LGRDLLLMIRIRKYDLHLIELRTRMPFRYGIATMTRVPQIFVRLWVEADGKEAVGISSDCLPPKWFTKIPDKPLQAEIQEMLVAIQHALKLGLETRGATAFELWRHLYQAQQAWGKAEGLPALLSNFGTSLVERALIEAVCRATGKTFAQMLRENVFRINLEEIHPTLRGKEPSDLLPKAPLSKVLVRHTVGLADPLTDADIAPNERLNDGLPQSLDACIRAYGLRHFKIKVNGDLPQDTERLSRIATIVQKHASLEFAFSLDGNEQFKSLVDFREFWEKVTGRAELRDFFGHLLFVEQPLHRDQALQPEVGAALQEWPQRPPFIIDESDGTLEDLPAAIQLGYAGTSHKNCKGIFKGIANRCLLNFQSEQTHHTFLMSGEDLCNIGPVALLQDLAVMAALGIQSVERNGHHYHAGLSQLPEPIQRETLAHHSDLYQKSRDGWATLRIANGEIDLGSVNEAPFGVGFLVDVEQFSPL